MRLGSDALKLPLSGKFSPVEQFDRAHAEGLEGLFFRALLHVSQTLDAGELAEVKAHADHLGMYVEAGLGRVNPFNVGESPELRALGDGDTLLGYRRIIEAAAAIGVTELWAETATIKPYGGRFAYDRFRTDVPWEEQLEATIRLLRRIAPIAKANGIHVNLETHEEITSFELVRIVEAVGPDAVGITYDTANLLQRVEHPVWTARRVAPYVRQTHIKDAAVFHVPDGMNFQMRPNGGGMVDLGEILPILFLANPDLNLSLEVRDYSGIAGLPRRGGDRAAMMSLYEPTWQAGHPDLEVPELFAFLGLAQDWAQRVESGEVPGYDEYAAAPWGEEEAWDYVRSSRAHVLASLPAGARVNS